MRPYKLFRLGIPAGPRKKIRGRLPRRKVPLWFTKNVGPMPKKEIVMGPAADRPQDPSNPSRHECP